MIDIDTARQCIFAVLKRVIFCVDENKLPEGEVALAHILERQISCFADLETLEALLKHLGDSPWNPAFTSLLGGFSKENPRLPFSRWQMRGLDSDFQELVEGLTDFDPAKRLAADEASGMHGLMVIE